MRPFSTRPKHLQLRVEFLGATLDGRNHAICPYLVEVNTVKQHCPGGETGSGSGIVYSGGIQTTLLFADASPGRCPEVEPALGDAAHG